MPQNNYNNIPNKQRVNSLSDDTEHDCTEAAPQK